MKLVQNLTINLKQDPLKYSLGSYGVNGLVNRCLIDVG
jgi:hypothetical protein